MPSSLPSSSSAFPTTSATTANGVTHIDLQFATAMSKGSGAIFITDGTIQTVIDRVTGQPKLRVVGASFTKEIALDQVHVSGTHVLFDAAGLPAGHTWQIYMGAGTLLGGGKPAPAITVPGSASFTTPDVVVEPPPPLSATLALDGSSLKSGEEITVTISFNKAVASLAPDAFAAGNATISDLATSDGGRTWTATLTGQAARDVPGNVLRLNMESVTASDGSQGSGVVTSSAYAVDTMVAAWISSDFELYGDAGPFYRDYITNDDHMEIGGYLHGALKTGESIELVINGRTIPTAEIQIISLDSTQEFYWYYSSAGTVRFDEGNNSVQARVIGPDGHASMLTTHTVVVETDSPDIVSAPTGPVDAGGAFSITFDEKLYFEDHAEISTDIRVVDAFGNTSWIALDQDNLSADGRTLTLQAADHHLATGNSYRLYLPYSLTDLAGNRYEGAPIAISTSGPYQDKAPPRLVQIYLVNGDGVYAEGQVLEFRMRFSEKVNLAAGTELELELDNGETATYMGLANDGHEMVFRYTVGAGHDTDELDVWTPWAILGNVHDDAGNVLQNAHIEYDGLTSAGGYGAQVEIDTFAARPGAPLLHPDSDTGTVGDRTTDDATPHLSGSGAEAGAEISLYLGDVRIGSATADEDGQWDTVLTAPLPAGTHEIRAVQEDRVGNVSPVSDALVLTITGSALPEVAPPHVPVLSDTGVSDSDGITSDATPELRGSGPANTTFTLLRNGEEVREVTTDASGVWSTTLPELADGVHSFQVRQGLDGPTSVALSVTVDRTRPTVAASPDGATHFNPDGDLVITFSEAIHVALAEGDSAGLVLRDGDNNLTTIAREAMSFLADGKTMTIAAAAHDMRAGTDYRITLPSTLTDLAGNPMAEYQIMFHTGNNLLPRAFRAEVPSGDHYYRAGETLTIRIRFNETVVKHGDGELWLGLSNDARATFSGISGNDAVFTYTVAAGDDVEHLAIVDRSKLAGQIADLEGNLLDNAHIVFGGLSDSAGYGNWIDIDTVAPVKPGTPELDPGSNTGSLDDLLTASRIPKLTGHGAEPGARIALYEGGTLLGYGDADDAGAWEVTVLSENRLSAGVHQLTVRQVDPAGNQSIVSDALSITVDHVAEPPPAPALAAASDSGALGDGITNDSSPTLSGTAEAFAELSLYRNAVLIGSATADAHGAWTATIGTETALADGVHNITLTQIDAAGNVSFEGAPLVLTIDTAPPNPPHTPTLARASDTGVSDNDGITADSTPTLHGGGAEAGATIVLYAGATEITRVVADGAGNWDYTVPDAAPLEDGNYTFTVRQIDKAGNASIVSDGRLVTIDTDPPAITSFGAARALREFKLGFDETIVFRPNGEFSLLESASTLQGFRGSSSGNWYTSGGSGGADSVLNFKISVNGLFKLVMHNDAVQDVAGNVAAIVGTPDWSVDLRLPA